MFAKIARGKVLGFACCLSYSASDACALRCKKFVYFFRWIRAAVRENYDSYLREMREAFQFFDFHFVVTFQIK